MFRIEENTAPTDLIQRETIDIYDVFRIKNIKSYTHADFHAWEVETHDISSYTERIYFAADTFLENAFAHWVFECAIYLPLFKILQKRHPSIKLYLRSVKTYKSLFCKYFDIAPEDIVYEFNAESSSICYFPSPISALNDKRLHPDFAKQVDVFWDRFKYTTTSERYSVTVMPRQTKENYIGNNRNTPLSLITNFVGPVPLSNILNTDLITELVDQINVIRESRVIVMTDGSPILVNGLFSYNKNLIISGSYMCTPGQAIKYEKIKYIIDKIKSQNKSFDYISDESRACLKIYEHLSSA